MNKKAFTLIELLVVVLIIGILAAIALPQYQKAVMRTRYATLKNLARSIADAEEVYYMANGQYSVDFEELDVQMPGGELNNSTATTYRYNWGYCSISNSADYAEVTCRNSLINMDYGIRFVHAGSGAGRAYCRANGSSDTNTLQAQICKTETGKATPGVTSTEAGYTGWWY